MINKILFRIFILVICFLCISIQKNFSNEIFRRIITKEIIIDGKKYQHFFIEKTENKNIDNKYTKLVNHVNNLKNNSHQQTLNIVNEELNEIKVCNDYLKNIKFEIYPNPVTDRLNISAGNNSEKITSISVLDLTGKTMNEFIEVNYDNRTLNVHNLTNGIYLIKITLHDRVTQTLQFIKQ